MLLFRDTWRTFAHFEYIRTLFKMIVQLIFLVVNWKI